MPTKWMIVGAVFALFGLTACSMSQANTAAEPMPIRLLYLSENGDQAKVHQYDIVQDQTIETGLVLPIAEQPESLVWFGNEQILFVSRKQGFINYDLREGGAESFVSHRSLSFWGRSRPIGVSHIGSLDWCADREQLVVTGSGVTADFGWVETLQLSGKQIKQVSQRSGYTDIACSPDNRSVAVVDTIKTSGLISLTTGLEANASLQISEDEQIYLAIVSLADGEARRLTRRGFAVQPSWSPTGSQIAFVGRFAEDMQGRQIYLVNVETQRREAVTSFVEADLATPVWSPDGETLAFIKDGDVWLLEMETGQLVQLTQTPEREFAPVWTR